MRAQAAAPRRRGWRTAGDYFGLVKFEHTVFALPFALIALLVATGGRPSRRVLLGVLVAMIGARSAAMAFNRLADRDYDARNPRTADRHLPAGRIGVAGAATFTAASALVFVLAARSLNPLCFALAPVALAVVLGYSYAKRFTPWSHLVLGLGLAIAPTGAWLAATGRFAAFPLWMSAGVMLWVGGFDAIYGCQDVEVDRREGLRSLAVRFGVPGALGIAKGLHVLAVLCLAIAFRAAPAFGVTADLGLCARLGLVAMTLLLLWEHRLVRGGDLRRIDRAFFTINSWIGMLLLLFVACDIYLV